MIRTLVIALALIGLGWMVLTVAPKVDPADQTPAQEQAGLAASKAAAPDRASVHPTSTPAGTADTWNEGGSSAAGAPSVEAIQNRDSTAASAETKSAFDAKTQANRADRNVTPDGMTRGPRELSNLKRIAPRSEQWAPASPLAESRPREPKIAATKPEDAGPPAIRQMLLPRPVAIDTAHLKIGEGTILLPGIEPLPLDQECGEGDETWPCGMRARTAFRAFLRSRSIRCTVPTDFVEKEQTKSSECTVGGGDIGAWLIQNGWAKAKPDGPYADREARAQKAGRGVWGHAPSPPRQEVGERTLVPMPAPPGATQSSASPPSTARPPAVTRPAIP